ncbi:hypothetical protein AG4045_023027, partial [Apium graveolens]
KAYLLEQKVLLSLMLTDLVLMREILLDRLLKTADEDTEKLLRKLCDRINSIEVSLPKIKVRYDILKQKFMSGADLCLLSLISISICWRGCFRVKRNVQLSSVMLGEALSLA